MDEMFPLLLLSTAQNHCNIPACFPNTSKESKQQGHIPFLSLFLF